MPRELVSKWKWIRLVCILNGWSPTLKVDPLVFLYRKLRHEQPELEPERLEELLIALWT